MPGSEQLPPADEMLLPERIDAYAAQQKNLWKRLVRVHTSLVAMDRVGGFPFQKMIAPREQWFWQNVIDNFGDAVVLILSDLVNGSGDCLTIRRFANCVLEWLRPEYREEYRTRLRNARFDEELRAIAEKVRALRDEHVAHTLQELDAPAPKSPRPGVSGGEINTLFKRVRSSFEIACLNTQFLIEPEGYGTTLKGEPETPDIERVLNLVAKDSFFVSEAEKRPQAWQIRRKTMTAEELEEVNGWRKRVGLPPA